MSHPDFQDNTLFGLVGQDVTQECFQLAYKAQFIQVLQQFTHQYNDWQHFIDGVLINLCYRYEFYDVLRRIKYQYIGPIPDYFVNEPLLWYWDEEQGDVLVTLDDFVQHH